MRGLAAYRPDVCSRRIVSLYVYLWVSTLVIQALVAPSVWLFKKHSVVLKLKTAAANMLQRIRSKRTPVNGLSTVRLPASCKASERMDKPTEAEFRELLKRLTGSKESIQSLREWVMARVDSIHRILELILQHVRQLAIDGNSTLGTVFVRTLHAVYLLNDCLFAGVEFGPEANLFEGTCLSCLHVAQAARQAAKKQGDEAKVVRVVELWYSNRLFGPGHDDQLRAWVNGEPLPPLSPEAPKKVGIKLKLSPQPAPELEAAEERKAADAAARKKKIADEAAKITRAANEAAAKRKKAEEDDAAQKEAAESRSAHAAAIKKEAVKEAARKRAADAVAKKRAEGIKTTGQIRAPGFAQAAASGAGALMKGDPTAQDRGTPPKSTDTSSQRESTENSGDEQALKALRRAEAECQEAKANLERERKVHQSEMADAMERFQEELAVEKREVHRYQEELTVEKREGKKQIKRLQVRVHEMEARQGLQKSAADYRKELSELYSKYCPEKVGSVDKLIRQNKGKEEVLIQQVKAKYCNVEGDSGEGAKHAELINQINKLKSCEKDAEGQKKRILLLEKELSDVRATAQDVPRLEAELAAARHQAKSLHAVHSELGTLKDVTKNTTAMSEEILRLNGALKEMEQKLALSDRESERHRKEMEKVKRNAEIEADQFCRAAEREAERQVRDAKASADKRIREAEKEIGDAGRHASRKEAERDAMEKQVSKLTGAEHSRIQLEQENGKLRAEIRRLTPETPMSKKVKADKQIADAQTQLGAMREQLDKEREYAKELEGEVARLNQLCCSLQSFREEADGSEKRAKSVPRIRQQFASAAKAEIVAGVRTISHDQL